MNTLINLISTKNWHAIANQYKQKFLAENLSFKEGRLLAYNIIFNEENDDSLREYAVKILGEIQQIYSEEWSSDWKNDFFLGDIYYMVMNYNKRYASYIRAYAKADPAPAALLISLASCCFSPEPFISITEAKKLVEIALEKEMCIEGVVLLRGIYADIKDQRNFDYWSKILKEVEDKKIYAQNA